MKKVYLLLSILIVLTYSLFFLLHPLDLLGAHSWDESTYTVILDNCIKNNDLFKFNGANDRFNPQSMSGFITIIVGFLFLKAASLFIDINVTDNFLFVIRLFSLITTLLSFFILRKLLLINKNSELTSFLGATLFLISPIVLWYGVKFKTEPISILLFIICLYFYFNYLNNNKIKNLIFSLFFFSLSVVNKSSIIILSPLLVYDLFISMKRGTIIRNMFNAVMRGIFTLVFIIVTLGSIDLINYIRGYNFFILNFFFKRFIVGGSLIQYTDPNLSGNIIMQVLTNTLLTAFSVYLIFLIIPFLFNSKKDFMLKYFSFFTLLMILISFNHMAAHDYYVYFFIIPAILSLSELLTKIEEKYNKKLVIILAISILLINVGLLQYKYGFFNGEYLNKDPHGNMESKGEGEIYKFLIEKTNLSKEDNYIIMETPIDSFYSKNPGIFWDSIYHYDFENEEYLSVSYLADCKKYWEFLDTNNKTIVFSSINVANIAKYYNHDSNVDKCENEFKKRFFTFCSLNDKPLYANNKFFKEDSEELNRVCLEANQKIKEKPKLVYNYILNN